jgi:hypothetical protein
MNNSVLLIEELAGKQINNKQQNKRVFIKRVVRDALLGFTLTLGVCLGLALCYIIK